MSDNKKCTHANNLQCSECSALVSAVNFPSGLDAYNEGYADGRIDGLEDGFDKAVRMLRSKEAMIFEWDFEGCVLPEMWADWLKSNKNDAQGS